MEEVTGLTEETFALLKSFYHNIKKPHLAYWRKKGHKENQGGQLPPTTRHVTEGILDYQESVDLSDDCSNISDCRREQ